MSKRGHPETLTEAKRREVLALLSVGCSRRTAASYVNCDPKTIYNTARRDPAFADAVARAEFAVEIAHLRNVLHAARDRRYCIPRVVVWIRRRERALCFVKPYWGYPTV